MDTFSDLCRTPLFGVTLTLFAYWLAQKIQAFARGSSFLSPLLVSIIIIITVLNSLHISYAEYFSGAKLLHFLLGPATVALAIPLVDNIRPLKRSLLGILVAVNIGGIVSVVSGGLLVRLLGGNASLAISMAPKSTTTPIAISIAESTGGSPQLTAALAVSAGVIAVIMLHSLHDWWRKLDWRAHGLGAGTAGSGLATAHMVTLNSMAAAFAGVALGLNGIFTAFWTPLLVDVLPFFH